MSLRTGAQYLEALRDRREVWLDGYRVQDVPSNPKLAPFATVLAEIFDLQHDPSCRDLLTTVSPSTGELVGLGHQMPRSSEDLIRQRYMFEFLQRRCGGVLGRFPQYMATVLRGLYSVRSQAAAVNPDFAGNIERYVAYCRENDLSLTFGFTDPPRDRNQPASVMDYLKVVDRRPEGVVIRGAKAIATLAPYADEYLGLTSPRPDLLPENVLYFGIPLATPGLKVVCRESFTSACSADHPLSAKYDEMDAWVLFDDVFVPQERIFFMDRVDLNDAIFRQIPSTWGYYAGLIRLAVKLEALAGICFAVAEYLGTRKAPQTEQLLAEIVAHLETLRTFIRAAETNPFFSPDGLAVPNPTQIQIGRIYSLDQHERMLQIVRDVCGSGILMAPGEPELENGEVGGFLRRYVAGSDPRALERFRLMKLAWEYTADSFGSRQMLFELHNAGTLAANRTRMLSAYDPTALMDLAKRLAGIDSSAKPP